MMSQSQYQVLVTYHTREGKDFPLRYSRHVSPKGINTATRAAEWALRLTSVAALGDLFVSITVSSVGKAGVKA